MIPSQTLSSSHGLNNILALVDCQYTQQSCGGRSGGDGNGDGGGDDGSDDGGDDAADDEVTAMLTFLVGLWVNASDAAEPICYNFPCMG